MKLKSSIATKAATRLDREGIEGLLENDQARRWGILLHTALLLLEGTDEEHIKVAVSRAFCILGEKKDEKKEEKALRELKNLLTKEHSDVLFPQKNGKLLAERSFLDERGNILRPDRVVIYPEKAIVVDFKTRKPVNPKLLEEYKKQIKAYQRTIYQALNRPTEGYLLFIQESHLEKVE